METAIARNTSELERLEGIITRNLQSFYEVGRALMEIRDRGYYRDVLGFDTFEAYCKEKWDFASNYARRLIASAETFDNVKNVPIGTVPSTETQCRPLASLPADQQCAAWRKAVETAPEGKVTAAHVYKIVKGMTETEKQPPARPVNRPIIQQEPIGEMFQAAFDQMVIELKNARAMKWKTTSHKGAIELMQTLLTIAEI